MANTTKITARAFVRNVRSFEELIKVLNIGSVEDIPTREELEATITAGNHTARDIWFAKMYKSGLNLKLTQAIREGKYNLSDETKNILYHMEAAFPPVGKSKQSIGGIVSTIKQHIKNIPDYYSRKYIDIKPELKKVSGTDSKTLNTVEQVVLDVGLPIEKEKTTNIFNYIEDMNDYDSIMRKIFTGIASIPDKTLAGIPDKSLRRNILINLLGTRFDQNLDMAGSKYLARMGDPERAWYNPKTGIVVGEYVKSGKKQLPPNVPLGPYMRDMMDQQWVDVTDGGKLATDVGMWDSLPENIKGGDIVNRYLFKITTQNPQGIFTNAEIELLGRVPKGFTDLRRLTLAWNARRTGNEAVADQLLGHGVDSATGKAITAPADGLETVSAVGRGYYLPGKPTPIENLRAFNIALEQNVARLLGHKDYHSLNGEWNVIGTDLETGITGKFINDVEVFKQETIVYPDSADSIIKLQDLSKQDLDFAPDPEIIAAREQERLAETVEGTAMSNVNIYQQAINLMKKWNKVAGNNPITIEEAYERILDRSKVPKLPVKLTGASKEVADRIDSMTDKNGKINLSRRLDNQTPATEEDIKNAEKKTGANRNTRAGRNAIRNFLKGVGKYMPAVSFGLGLWAADAIKKQPSQAFEPSRDPETGKINRMEDQIYAAFGIDTGEERQQLRADWEKVTGAFPGATKFFPGSVFVSSKQERIEQKEHQEEISNFLAEEEVY